ncbi:hypothetical protein MRX96_019089 [Rhipicephalus microplus]
MAPFCTIIRDGFGGDAFDKSADRFARKQFVLDGWTGVPRGGEATRVVATAALPCCGFLGDFSDSRPYTLFTFVVFGLAAGRSRCRTPPSWARARALAAGAPQPSAGGLAISGFARRPRLDAIRVRPNVLAECQRLSRKAGRCTGADGGTR